MAADRWRCSDSAGQQLGAVNVSNSPGINDEAFRARQRSPHSPNGNFAVTWRNVEDDDIYTAIYNAQGQLVLAPTDVTHSPRC